MRSSFNAGRVFYGKPVPTFPENALNADVDLGANPGRRAGETGDVCLRVVDQLDHRLGGLGIHLHHFAREGDLHLVRTAGHQAGGNRCGVHGAYLRKRQYVHDGLMSGAKKGRNAWFHAVGLVADRQALVSILASLALPAAWIRATACLITMSPVPVIRFDWAVARPWAIYWASSRNLWLAAARRSRHSWDSSQAERVGSQLNLLV